MSNLTLELAAERRADQRRFAAAAWPDRYTDAGLERLLADLEADRVLMSDLARRRGATIGGERYASLAVAIAATIAPLRAELAARAAARAEAKARLSLVR